MFLSILQRLYSRTATVSYGHLMKHNAAEGTDGRQERGDARRVVILAAATKEFAMKGYATSRIADIAKSAGVTDAGILHHFPTKQELFMAVVQQREDAYHVLNEPVTSARDLFDKMILSVQEAAREPNLVRFRVMLTGASLVKGHPIEGRASRQLADALTNYTPVLERAVAQGELAPGLDARQVILELLALNEGIREQWAILPDEVDYPGAFATAVNRLYASIAA